MTERGERAVPSIRPTRRGVGVATVLVVAFALAWVDGLRSLHAAMVPLLVALGGAVVMVARTPEPRVRRDTLRDGFIGERRTVETTVDVDRPTAATVVDTVGAGLDAVGDRNRAEMMLQDESHLRYDIEVAARGEHVIGPTTVEMTDLLGLVSRRFAVADTSRLVGYPRVHDLASGDGRDLRVLDDLARTPDDEEFDHIREYARGDAVRHIHWKSAAKQPGVDLLIKEFDDTVDRGDVTVAAECAPGHGDEMATAAATVVTYLLRTGVAVGLCLPTSTRPPGAGRDHHRALLRELALTGSGTLTDPARNAADVVVRADDTGTVVVVGDREMPFDRLRGDSNEVSHHDASAPDRVRREDRPPVGGHGSGGVGTSGRRVDTAGRRVEATGSRGGTGRRGRSPRPAADLEGPGVDSPTRAESGYQPGEPPGRGTDP